MEIQNVHTFYFNHGINSDGCCIYLSSHLCTLYIKDVSKNACAGYCF